MEMSLNEVLKNLDIEIKGGRSKTLEKMTPEEILNMTPEQAKKICEEVGTGWSLSNEIERIDFLDFGEIDDNGIITFPFNATL